MSIIRIRYSFFLIGFILFLFSCSEPEYPYDVRIINIHLDSLSKVIPLTDSSVVPVLYDTLRIDNHLPVSEVKQQFISEILPAILIVSFFEQLKYDRIAGLLDKVNKNNKLKPDETFFLDSLCFLYEETSYENLLERIKLHPTSLVLAQAALESGWGQSRFAIEGNNLFGIISHSKENSIASKKRRKTYMRKYNSTKESIEHYFFVIGKNNAYHNFRIKRFNDSNVYQLIDELDNYSINGEHYTEQLKQIIYLNDLTQYDNYKLDESYIYTKNSFRYLILKIKQNIITK